MSLVHAVVMQTQNCTNQSGSCKKILKFNPDNMGLLPINWVSGDVYCSPVHYQLLLHLRDIKTSTYK